MISLMAGGSSWTLGDPLLVPSLNRIRVDTSLVNINLLGVVRDILLRAPVIKRMPVPSTAHMGDLNLLP
jgi:hypothetical protein